MTKSEVETLIQEELRRAMGKHVGLLNLRETDSMRQAREAAEERQLKEAKRQRKAEKRLNESSREVYRSLGMSKREAKFAAQGRPEFRG